MMGLSRACALLVLSLGVAAAQPKPPTAPQKAEIEKLAKQAIAKSQKGDHEGAIKDYLDAYAIAPGPTTNILLSNIGHEYKVIKKPYEALKYFCMYLEKEPTGAAANYVLAEASGIWKELGNKEGEVCVEPAEPPPPDPKPKPDPKPDPGNGQVTGTTPTPSPEPVSPSSGGGGLRIAGLGIAGAGVVTLAAGFVFGLRAAEKGDAITAGPPIDPATGMQIGWGPNPELGWDGIVKLEQDGEKAEKMQIALTAVGGALIIGGTALYFLGRSKKGTSEKMTVSASAGSNGASFVLGGRF